MTTQEMLKLLEYQVRTIVHLHGVAEGKKWMDLFDGVKQMAEENEMFRENLEYCQKMNGACRRELKEKTATIDDTV